MKIKIKHTFLGLHNWIDCPIKEVSFLKNKHLHHFIVYVQADIEKSRGIEFIMLELSVMKILDNLYNNFYLKK